MTLPHLVDSESVRREAASAHGSIDDAAKMIQVHKANIDPNVEATALKKINVPETEKLKEELELEGFSETVNEKLSAALGDDHGITPVSVAVRGQALSVVGYDEAGRPVKVVVPYTDRYVSIGLSPAEQAERENALKSGKGALTADLKKEVAKLVGEATSALTDEISELRAKLAAKSGGKSAGAADAGAVETATAGAVADDDAGAEGEGDAETSSEGDGTDVKWPRQHDKLDEIAKNAKVTFSPEDKTIDAKIAALEAAGVKPE